MSNYDVIVIGAGHAGCEAAHAAAVLGCRTAIITLSKENIGFMPCNPSIGGTAKGHLVCEIDALGGLMGIIADKTALQIRMLNEGKGSAVASLRAQIDKEKYHEVMQQTLEATPNLTILEDEVIQILRNDTSICGIRTKNNGEIHCRAVIVATGVYLKSKTFVGSVTKNEGPAGFPAANSLSQSLIDLGLEVRRFKTGTPARVDIESVDFGATAPQPGDDNIQSFSFISTQSVKNTALCHLTYTNPDTHKIIRDNIKKSAMYGGLIVGIGPRYCPSIEDKVMRFADRERHQVFLEPETANGREIYLQGLSTSLPADIQKQFIHSIDGLRNAALLRNGYAIEYDCIDSLQLLPTLQYKNCSGLYFAGQVNGTSGYEEAAAQGLLSGINAGLFCSGTEQIVLPRTNSYIGVLVDDLTTVGTTEPYRMFTARAEHRLFLRQDNADSRLTPTGRKVGLVDDNRWNIFIKKQQAAESLRQELNKFIPQKTVAEIFAVHNIDTPPAGMALRELLRRPGITLSNTIKNITGDEYPKSLLDQITAEVKYEGYLSREQSKIAEAKRQEAKLLPPEFDYAQISGLRKEAQIKLNRIKPLNIGQASRISGVTPADIAVLIIYFRKISA